MTPQARARYLVGRAIRRGILIRPACCSRCEQPSDRVHAHHFDYSKPLVVEWLCQGCHASVHAQERAARRREAAEARAAARRAAAEEASLDRRAIGLAVLVGRKRQRISREELGRRAIPPLPVHAISALEHGAKPVTLALLRCIAEALGVSAAKFMALIDEERHLLAQTGTDKDRAA